MVLNGEDGKAEEIFQVDKNDAPYSKKLKSNKFNFSQNLHKILIRKKNVGPNSVIYMLPFSGSD